MSLFLSINVEFHSSFSRHGRIEASFTLLIWLNENVGLLTVLQVVLHNHIKQGDGAVLHVAVDSLNLGKDEVVEHLKHKSNDNTEDGGDKSDFHTSITLIDDLPQDADTFFPLTDSRDWLPVLCEPHPADERHAHPYTFIDYIRRD